MGPLAVLLIVFSAAFCIQSQPKPDTANGRLSELAFFAGSWSCKGHFVRSGKALEADLSFENVLDGKWIIFRHDDRPPLTYHALSEWGWSERDHEYVNTVQDSTGSLRVFHSPGWSNNHLTWNGSAIGSEIDEQFEFERLPNSEFSVTYSRLTDGKWIMIDSSVCGRLKQ